VKKKNNAQLQLERIEKQQLLLKRDQEKHDRDVLAEQRRHEAEHRAYLRQERSKPREEMPASYDESIYVHKRILDGFMKQVGKKINIASSKVVGGAGGSYILEYTTRQGGRGTLELFDLGPMPEG
jgi:hypothetical protein